MSDKMRKQPVFKSNRGTEFRLVSVRWDEDKNEFIARGMYRHPLFDGGMSDDTRTSIPLKYLTGTPVPHTFRNRKTTNITWKYDRTERRR